MVGLELNILINVSRHCPCNREEVAHFVSVLVRWTIFRLAESQWRHIQAHTPSLMANDTVLAVAP
jgi:hypothetical protein